MFKIEHNVETGEVKQIELTPEEITELEQQYAETKIKEDARATELAAQTAAEEAAKQQAFNDAVAAAVAAALAAQTPATTAEPTVEE